LSIEKNYNNLKKEAKKLSVSELVLSGNIIGGEWFCPGGNSFNARLFKDANISYNYFNNENTGSISLSQEKILSENIHAKYWINPGVGSLLELKNINSKAILFDAYKNKQVYCYFSNKNFFWEISSIEPDKILSDLITITHPDLKFNRKLYFYNRLK
jgi:iron complex transport system substrate-binding protein